MSEAKPLWGSVLTFLISQQHTLCSDTIVKGVEMAIAHITDGSANWYNQRLNLRLTGPISRTCRDIHLHYTQRS